MTRLLTIALRDGICVDEVQTLLMRWIWPMLTDYETALKLAEENAPAWQAWREHHHELCVAGYTWPLIRL